MKSYAMRKVRIILFDRLTSVGEDMAILFDNLVSSKSCIVSSLLYVNVRSY